MKVDAFTKVLLVIIAVFLGIIVLRPLFQSKAAFGKPGSYDYVRPVGSESVFGVEILDTRNGDLWLYDFTDGSCHYTGKLVELGKPIQQKK